MESRSTRFVGIAVWIAVGILILAPTIAFAQSYSFSLPATSGGAGGGVTLSLSLDSSSGNGITGFRASICHDPLVLVPVAIDPGVAIATIQGGGPPELFSVTVDVDGISCFVIFAPPLAITVLPPGPAHELIDWTYMIQPAAVVGSVTTLTYCSLGTGIGNVVFASGSFIPMVLIDGSVDILPAVSPTTFVRGDVDQNGVTSVTDAVILLEHLFLGVPTGHCPRTADVNQDDGLNIADAIALLNGLIFSAQPIPPPWPSCDVDLVPSPIPCLPYPSCP